MARPETLIARNREGIQGLDPKRLRLLEDRPRTRLRLLDQDLSGRRRTWVLPLARRREEAPRVGHECFGLGVVCHQGLGVRGQWLALCRHGVRRTRRAVAVRSAVGVRRARAPCPPSPRRRAHGAGQRTAKPSCHGVGFPVPARSARLGSPVSRGARAPHARSIGRREATVN